jgi:deazaflavin-dependent oxidoreductase (nitroreductase family)
MVFEIPPNGRQGAWIPGGRPIRRARAVISAFLYRLTFGQLIGRHGLLLTTIGARSGAHRTTLLRRFDEGVDGWLVVASAGGAAKQPGWLVNLCRDPDEVWVEVRRERFKVRPELLRAEGRDAAWQRIVTEAPQFGGYQRKTDREIPVVRLTREASA